MYYNFCWLHFVVNVRMGGWFRRNSYIRWIWSPVWKTGYFQRQDHANIHVFNFVPAWLSYMSIVIFCQVTTCTLRHRTPGVQRRMPSCSLPPLSLPTMQLGASGCGIICLARLSASLGFTWVPGWAVSRSTGYNNSSHNQVPCAFSKYTFYSNGQKIFYETTCLCLV